MTDCQEIAPWKSSQLLPSLGPPALKTSGGHRHLQHVVTRKTGLQYRVSSWKLIRRVTNLRTTSLSTISIFRSKR